MLWSTSLDMVAVLHPWSDSRFRVVEDNFWRIKAPIFPEAVFAIETSQEPRLKFSGER